MPLVSMRQLLDHAAEHDYGLPAFNVNNLEQVQAIMSAAAETDSPVIMQASAGARKYAGEIFLRHLIIADDWLVHVHDRRAALAEEEIAALANFDSELLPQVRERVLRIADALDMDYFGIDCNLRADGSLLIFEANAMMDVLNNTSPSPNCWDAPIARIHDALASLLFDPARWRHPVRETATA